MKTKNSIGESKYYVYNILIGLIGFYIYYSSFFRTLEGYTIKQSNGFFCFLYVLFLVTGIMINANKRRNQFNIFINNIIPIEVITLVFYFSELKYWIIILNIIWVLLSVEYGINLIRRKIKSCPPYIKKKIITNRIKGFCLYARNLFAIVFSIILFVLFISNILIPVIVLLTDGQKAIDPNEELYSDWKIEAHYDDLNILLDEDLWEESSLQDRSRILQTVCNIEANFLGVNHEINLKISNENQISGSYIKETHTVIIYELNKITGEKALSTVLHECYHAMQHRAVEVYEQLEYDFQKLYYFYDAFIYKEEFENYANSRTDENDELFEYYFQQCEIDARNYSESKLIYYRTQIEELSQNNN